VYDRLAEVLVAQTPVDLGRRLVLDLGAGTGAAGRSVRTAGGTPVATDVSWGMLRADPAGSAGRAVVGDARRLPLATGALGGVVAAFSLNHLDDPATAFREAARVCRPGSPVLAAAYAADDHHPVKEAVEQALTEVGWAAAPWYREVRVAAVPLLATTDGMLAAARAGGVDGEVRHVVVDLSHLSPADLVSWRLGMAQTAPFLAGLSPTVQTSVRRRALELLGDPPPLRRSIITFAGTV
jgi:ubiquinone/menaquinone biosynthesis C-methylase UbiE